MIYTEMDYKDMWMDLKGQFLKADKIEELKMMEEAEQVAWEDACIKQEKTLKEMFNKKQVVING